MLCTVVFHVPGNFLLCYMLIYPLLQSSKKYLKEPSPYVRLELGNREAKSAVKHASTNPKWEEDFQFLVNDPEVQDLTVEVCLNCYLHLCNI